VTSRHGFRLFLAATLLVACHRQPVEKPPAKPEPGTLAAMDLPPDDTEERSNLLNIAHGASIVSRTGETTLENSAVQAIDGDPDSAWLSPPYDPDQTFVIALPSRTSIRQLGAKRSPQVRLAIRTIEFERSNDGVHFEPLQTLKLVDSGSYQLFPVTPAEASYLRVTMHDPGGPYIQLNSLLARGEALEPVAPRRIDGCWSINGEPAVFRQNGAAVPYGRIGELTLDGGSDGRFFRFVWTNKAEYGMAAISVSPDGNHLSGIKWHEEALPLFLGGSWFGDRIPCQEGTLGQVGTPDKQAAVFETFMTRFGRFPLYGLEFDAHNELIDRSRWTLDAVTGYLRTHPSGTFQFTGYGNPQQLTALRAALQKRGTDLSHVTFVSERIPRRDPVTDVMRSLYGNIDLQIRR
jgi:hypothetical protein